MRPPHPELKLQTGEGRFAVLLEELPRPIARGERLSDGTWVAALRIDQDGEETAVIVSDEAAALELLQPYCRALAWQLRPGAAAAMQQRGLHLFAEWIARRH